jgi:hypothetical protein
MLCSPYVHVGLASRMGAYSVSALVASNSTGMSRFYSMYPILCRRINELHIKKNYGTTKIAYGRASQMNLDNANSLNIQICH